MTPYFIRGEAGDFVLSKEIFQKFHFYKVRVASTIANKQSLS
jgi:hypothetical protein